MMMYDDFDDDDDFLDDADDFFEEDEFEDQAGMEWIKKDQKIPDEWIIVKVIDFNANLLTQIDEWLMENCHNTYKRIGWRSNCSTKVGVAFADPTDSILFKMRWR
jgi:hypothetical protein